MAEAPGTVLIWQDVDWPRSEYSSVTQEDGLAMVLAMPLLARI
jgi:hypothetical protein